MKYLVIALLFATIIGTIAHCYNIQVSNLNSNHRTNKHNLNMPESINDQRWLALGRELLKIALTSFSYVMILVLSGYFLIRLSFTYHRLLLLITGTFVLAIALLLYTGFFEVNIRWDKMVQFFNALLDTISSFGWIRITSFIIGAYFGYKAYINDK